MLGGISNEWHMEALPAHICPILSTEEIKVGLPWQECCKQIVLLLGMYHLHFLACLNRVERGVGVCPCSKELDGWRSLAAGRLTGCLMLDEKTGAQKLDIIKNWHRWHWMMWSTKWIWEAPARLLVEFGVGEGGGEKKEETNLAKVTEISKWSFL